MVHESAAGTLTFLFTDLEASTRLWEEHSDSMPAALARHDALVRMAVESNRGRVVKTTGDGTFAVFASAAAAVQAACDAQRELATEHWEQTGPLRARMAVHTGAAEERDGDYFGPTLNRTARLMAVGHGGQVLVSQATEAIVRDAIGLELIDLGDHRLRDLSRPEHVYQVVVPGQPTDFAPLRSLDVLPTNLPVQLTSFIGRTDELERVRALVDDHRVVTITGVGGVGKTRLALQVAGEMVGGFADGAWYCELAAATDDEAMVGIVAATLGVQPRTGMTLEDSIAEFLRPKEMLWILDNCEHLIDAVARMVDRVMHACPRVKVLATSREALDVDGERAMSLRSMTVAGSDELDAVAQSDAVRLFLDRATSARAEFVLDESNAATVNTICRRLDGIPLAIELAAVRVVSMSPSEIAARLDERFRLLTGGRRVALERHQTLRAAVEWSYELLDQRERLVFERLAVFAGSFDGAAVGAVVIDDVVTEWDAIDALDGLVRKSLVLAEEQVDGEVRYQMLETLRQYARDRLDERGETDDWRQRHAQYFASLAERIGEELLGPDEFAWRARLGPDIDNIRTATSWAIDREDIELALRMIVALADEWRFGPQLGVPATRALGLAPRLADEQRLLLLAVAAVEAYALGDVPRSHELARTVWDAAIDLDLTVLVGLMLLRGMLGIGGADLMNQASKWARRTVAELERLDIDATRRARLYSSSALYAFRTDDLESARAWAARGLQVAQDTHNPTAIAHAFSVYGQLNARDDPEAARQAWEQCIAIGRQGGRTGMVGSTWAAVLYQLALLSARGGDAAGALAQLRESIELLSARGRSPEFDGLFGYAISILDLLGAREAALTLIGSVLGGTLQNLREMSMPPERTAPNVRDLREAVGRERFDACIARGKEMSYDQLIAWLLETIDGLATQVG